jgi:predicted transcriptional regulator
MGDWEAVSRAGLSSSFVRSVLDSQQLWHQEFDELRQRVRTTRIREIMRPAGVSVAAEAPLTDAIHYFVIYQTLSLLVQEGEEVVGILRLSDVYRYVYDSLRDDPSEAR